MSSSRRGSAPSAKRTAAASSDAKSSKIARADSIKEKVDLLSAEKEEEIFYQEEEVARNTDFGVIQDNYKAALAEVTRLSIAALKLKSPSGEELDEAVKTQLKEITITGACALVQLKRASAHLHYKVKHARAATSAGLRNLETKHIHLQNHQYEAFHLKKQTEQCLSFRSAADDLVLVPEEEMRQRAPADLVEKCSAGDEHQLTKTRLLWELEERKLLEAELTAARSQRDEGATDVSHRQTQLTELVPKVRAVLAACGPVEELLSLPSAAVASQQKQLARLLPPPLYTAYLKLRAFDLDPAQEDLEIEIEGDAASAENFSVTTAAELTAAPSGGAHKKGRHSVSAEPKSGKIVAFPLSVVIRVNSADKSSMASLSVTLKWLPQLEIVTAAGSTGNHKTATQQVLAPHHLLVALQDDCDAGDGLPHPAAAERLMDLKGSFSDVLAHGVPYKWVQRLAAMDTLDDGSPVFSGSLRPDHVESCRALLTALRSRLAARVSVAAALTRLADGAFNTSGRHGIKLSAASVVVTTEESSLRSLLDSGLIASNELAFSFRAEGHGRMSFVIPVNYPTSLPLFTLQLPDPSPNSDALLALEAELNLTGKCGDTDALSCQLHQLVRILQRNS